MSPNASSQRPSGPKVLGVLSIVFASMTIFSSLIGGCSLGMSRRGGHIAALSAMSSLSTGGSSTMAQAYQRYYDSIFLASLAQTALLLALSILLLFVGIGELRYRRWARMASVAWGAAGLAALGVMQVLSAAVFRPAAAQLMSELTRGMAAGSPEATLMSWMGSLMGGGAMSLTMVIFYLPYPVLLVIYFGRGSMKAVMSAEA